MPPGSSLPTGTRPRWSSSSVPESGCDCRPRQRGRWRKSGRRTRSGEAVIIATGSEVALAVEAQKTLATQHGIHVRVVSMPSTSIFDRQPKDYQDHVLPPDLPCVAVEAGSPDLWRKYVGRTGEVIGMTTFGESAPAGELFKHFSFTAGQVVAGYRDGRVLIFGVYGTWPLYGHA